MPANDAWASATVLATSGSGTDDLFGATQETGEPALDPSANSAAGTLWYTITPSGPGFFFFTVTASFGVVVEIMIGDSIDTLVDQDVEAGTNVTAIAGLSSGVPAYVRVYPQALPASSAPISYSYEFVADTAELSITLLDDCWQSPGAVVLHVGNLHGGDNVYFRIDNNPTPVLVLQVPNDSAGITVGSVFYVPLEEQLLFVAVPVAASYAKGTHVLEITADTSGDAIISFEVLNDSLDPAHTDPGDQGLAGLPTTAKWIFRDPAPGGETYVWEVNPNQMGSPYPERVITEDHTTAPDGQPLEWEGTAKAVQWSLSGVLLTQGQLEAFQRFSTLDHRFWVVDHFKRAWVVTLEELDAQPRQKAVASDFPWTHDWSMQLLIWGGPVDVS